MGWEQMARMYMVGTPQALLVYFQRCRIHLRLCFVFVNTGCYPPSSTFMSLSFNAMFSIFGAAHQVQWRLGCHFSQAVSGWGETDQGHRSPWIKLQF